MKKIITFIGLLGLVMIMTGCIPLSLKPLYHDDDLIFESKLLGYWANPDESDEVWKIEDYGKNGYRFSSLENGLEKDSATGMFRIRPIDFKTDIVLEAHLIELDGVMYFDFYPDEPTIVNDNLKSLVIPGHTFCKVLLKGDTLAMATIDLDWLSKGVKYDKFQIKHEILENDNFVLTASTKELQEFVIKYQKEAFKDFDVMYRIDDRIEKSSKK